MNNRAKHFNNISIFAVWAVVLCLSTMLLPQAAAQIIDPSNDHLCDPLSTCAGSNGGVTIITQSSLPNLSFTNVGKSESGTAYLVVLVPSTTNLNLSFTVNGSGSGITDKGVWTGGKAAGGIYDFLGQAYANNVGFGKGKGDFSNMGSAAAQAGIGTPTGFNVYLVKLGSYTTGTPLSISLGGIAGFPKGTVIWGYLVGSPTGGGKCSGKAKTCASDDVPLSEAVTLTGSPTPEPASMLLFGSGIAVLGGVLRRRLRNKS